MDNTFTLMALEDIHSEWTASCRSFESVFPNNKTAYAIVANECGYSSGIHIGVQFSIDETIQFIYEHLNRFGEDWDNVLFLPKWEEVIDSIYELDPPVYEYTDYDVIWCASDGTTQRLSIYATRIYNH